MFHLTLFGGTEGEIAPAGFTALTVFGSAQLRRPTLASQLLHLQRQRRGTRSRLARLLGIDQNLVLTVFAGTLLVAPTMVEEYAALTGLVRSGRMDAATCAGLLDELGARSDGSRCRTLTLFGACVVRQPSPARERKALDAARRAGTVSDRVRQALDDVVGSPPGARIRALGRLALA